jgi:hypothetical protein
MSRIVGLLIVLAALACGGKSRPNAPPGAEPGPPPDAGPPVPPDPMPPPAPWTIDNRGL